MIRQISWNHCNPKIWYSLSRILIWPIMQNHACISDFASCLVCTYTRICSLQRDKIWSILKSRLLRITFLILYILVISDPKQKHLAKVYSTRFQAYLAIWNRHHNTWSIFLQTTFLYLFTYLLSEAIYLFKCQLSLMRNKSESNCNGI